MAGLSSPVLTQRKVSASAKLQTAKPAPAATAPVGKEISEVDPRFRQLMRRSKRGIPLLPDHIALPAFAFSLDEALSRHECAALVHAGESLGFLPLSTEGDGHKSGILDCSDGWLAGMLWQRIAQHVPACRQGRYASGVSSRIQIVKYTPDHKTAARYVHGSRLPKQREIVDRPLIVLQIYLTDDVVGAGTRFLKQEADGDEYKHECKTVKGQALVFDSSLAHEHSPMESLLGAQYLLRAELTYRPPSSSAKFRQVTQPRPHPKPEQVFSVAWSQTDPRTLCVRGSHN